MRQLTAFTLLLGLATSPVMAQSAAALPHSNTKPAVELIDDSFQSQVTISIRDGNVVEEHRINGKLYRITVTPEHGAPYTLVDTSGDGVFVPMETPGASKLSIPMWVIKKF